jgi:acetyl-CoA synthetase
MGTERLDWFRDFDTVTQGGFEEGDVSWFVGGKLNVSYNCIDRHIANGKGDQVAIIWESDEPGQGKSITYNELLREVCRIAEVFTKSGVKKGDCVTVYMPMIPQCAYTMLACARIGAPHSVVFAGFSAEALGSRIVDGNSNWVVTADGGMRGGRIVKLKSITDQAIANIPESAGGPSLVKNVFCFKRTNENVNFVEGRDLWMEELCANARPYCPPESMDSEDTLFYLYTSGSTGKPKGIAHTQAGYLLYASMTQRYVFDNREGDIYACVADCGWITGHTYIVYGPLCNGGTTLMFESTPLYPDASRYWDMVERHKVTQFYTAPTAIRALMKYGNEPVLKHDLSSLRVLGTVGEPINPEAWKWYNEVVGKSQCAIVDTWWQTETGGNMLTPLPGVTPTKPGSATLPFFGVEPKLVNAQTGEELIGNPAEGVLCIARPWPGMARTVFNNHQRYLNVYMKPYPGLYFTGDGCIRDEDGYYWITGRVHDVMNVAGHRLGTAEIESALVKHDAVAEAAVVGFPHDIKGEGIYCYVILMDGQTESPELIQNLKQQVRSSIGPFAKPDQIVIVPGLPKTRSGKIMRRILRKTAAGEEDQLGDISTLADSAVIAAIIDAVKAKR